MNTNTTTEIVPMNCAPKETSLLVNGTANVPHTPATKCAGMAPTTSSIFNLNKSFVEKYINTPAIAPIKIAANGLGVNGSAVIPTNPAIAPFSIITTSVLPPINLDTVAAANTPPAAAKFVLIYIVATEDTSSIVPAANCDPPLKPNQPNQSINTPKVANGIDDAAKGAIGLASPLPENLPDLAPRTMAPAYAAAPPAACTSVEPAKSENPATDNHPPPHCQPIEIG